MSNVPPDIRDRVYDLALAITNASEAGDDVLRDSLTQTLRAFYEEQVTLGRSHPFLTETLADYTSINDPTEAVGLYQLAIEQERAFPDEPMHTKMICLAEHLIELGRLELAEAYLRDERAEAVRLNDEFWVEEADRLFRELAS